MKRVLHYLLVNGLFCAAVYFGCVEENINAGRIAIFYVWLMVFLSLFMMTDDVQSRLKEKGRTVPAWLDGSVDAVIITVLIWFGWWWTGVALLFHTAMVSVAHDKAAKTTESDGDE